MSWCASWHCSSCTVTERSSFSRRRRSGKSRWRGSDEHRNPDRHARARGGPVRLGRAADAGGAVAGARSRPSYRRRPVRRSAERARRTRIRARASKRGGRGAALTDPETQPVVERFVLSSRQARMTKAALETLAIVAYKQPVTRHQVSAIRGVNADVVLRALVDRGLIEEAGRDEGPGRPLLYATTPMFLERLGGAAAPPPSPPPPLLGR